MFVAEFTVGRLGGGGSRGGRYPPAPQGLGKGHDTFSVLKGGIIRVLCPAINLSWERRATGWGGGTVPFKGKQDDQINRELNEPAHPELL